MIESPNDLLIDVLPPDVAQGLNDQSTDFPRRGHIAGRGVLQEDLALANLDGSRTTIRKINDLHGNLGRQPKKIGGVGPGGLQTGGVTASQGARDVIRCRLQRPQLGIDFRVVIEPSGEMADKAAVSMSHQCEIDCTAGSEICEAVRRKDPASLAGLNPPENLAKHCADFIDPADLLQMIVYCRLCGLIREVCTGAAHLQIACKSDVIRLE